MFIQDFLIHLQVIVIAFTVNVIPAFAPPTWIVLGLYKINYPELNYIALALSGVIGSVSGRSVLYLYSKYFSKVLPQNRLDNISYMGNLINNRRAGLFFSTFIYSVNPLPSNFLFISSGISGVRILPIISGFAVGRGISYLSLMYASHKILFMFGFFAMGNMRLLADFLGISASISFIFIDWKSIFGKIRKTIRISNNEDRTPISFNTH